MQETPGRGPPGPKREGGTGTWLRYSHLGIQFTVTMLAFLFGGMWADRSWGTGPWLTVVGAFVGMTAATYVLIRQVGR